MFLLTPTGTKINLKDAFLVGSELCLKTATGELVLVRTLIALGLVLV